MSKSEVPNLISGYKERLEEAKVFFYSNLKEIEKNKKLSEEERGGALRCLNPAHIITKESKYIKKYSMGASFRVLMSNYMLEKKFYKKYSIAPGVNDKLKDARFVESLGFSTAQVISESATMIEAANYDQCIIKSIRGSSGKGVFLKKGENFYHFYDKKNYSREGFLRYSEKNNLNDFLIEEYVGDEDGVRDLKFYSFYGKVGAVLEIKREEGEVSHCFYDEEGRVIETGRYNKTAFSGGGFRKEERACAEIVSSFIPSPFVRIDIISSKNGFKVGEITAHPGGYEEFNDFWDCKLGHKFVEARARLLEDMVSGKNFHLYLGRS